MLTRPSTSSVPTIEFSEAREDYSTEASRRVTINEIMAEAGLTRGGFYNTSSRRTISTARLSFSSHARTHLSMLQGACRPLCQGGKSARMIMDAYLSREHFQDRDGLCPTLALPSDVSRSSVAVKRAFRNVRTDTLSAFVANLQAACTRARIPCAGLGVRRCDGRRQGR